MDGVKSILTRVVRDKWMEHRVVWWNFAFLGHLVRESCVGQQNSSLNVLSTKNTRAVDIAE